MQNLKTLTTSDQLKLLESVNAIAPGSAIYTVAGELAPTPMIKFTAYALPGEGGGGQPRHLDIFSFVFEGSLMVMASWRDRVLTLVYSPSEPPRWMASDASPTTQPSPLGAEFEVFAAAIFPILSGL